MNCISPNELEYDQNENTFAIVYESKVHILIKLRKIIRGQGFVY